MPLEVWASQLATGNSAGRSMQRFQHVAESAGKDVLEGLRRMAFFLGFRYFGWGSEHMDTNLDV